MDDDFSEMYFEKYLSSSPVTLSTNNPHMLFKSLKAWVVFPNDLTKNQMKIVVQNYPFMKYLWETRKFLQEIPRGEYANEKS